MTEYYIVTTASDDTALDLLVLELSQNQRQLGRIIDIQVFGWETLQQKIRADKKALDAFDPGHSPAIDMLIGITAESLSLGKVQQNQTEIIVQKIDEIRLTAPADTARGSALEAHLDKQIDEYRDLMNSGKPKTAADLLTKLELQLTPESSSAIRARVRGNLGWTSIILGETAVGGRLLLEAYTLNPIDPKAAANRVLGLILTGEVEVAFDFARELLAKDASNATAAAYAFHAGALRVDLDPESLVAASVQNDLIVGLHRLNFLRARNRTTDWRQEAASLFARYPDDDMTAQMAASALLDEAFEGNAFSHSPALNPTRKAKLREAVALLEPLWVKTRTYENAGGDQYWAIPVNLANAMRAQGRTGDAERVIAEAIAAAPDNPDALATGVFLAMEQDDSARALQLIESLPDGAMKVVQRLNAQACQGDWAGLLDYASAHPPQPAWSEDDQAHFDALVYQARAVSLEGGALRALTDALVDRWPSSVAVLALAGGRIARSDPEQSDLLKARAVALLDDKTPFGDRLMLAQLAGLTNDYNGVIRSLDGAVATEYPTRGLLMLAWAFANASPRPRTRPFFDELPAAVIDQGEFARLAGSAHAARGDLKAAERYLRTALADDAADLRAALMLYGVLQRQNRDADARAFALALEENIQKGSPEEFIRLATILRREGATDRALALAYRMARTHSDKSDVVGAYPALLLMAKHVAPAVTQLTAGGPDAGFDLEGIDTADVRGVIEVEAWEDSYKPDHPLARAIAGKTIGEDVVLDRLMGGPLRYRVRYIRHKYLWLLQDISNRFATRFPEANNFIAMKVAEGDIQPILDAARQTIDPNRALVQAYAESPLPLAAIAAMSSRNVMEMAEMVASSGGQVRVCFGANDERLAAIEAVKQAKGKGAVVDTLALWTLHRFGLLEVAKTYFGRLVVTRSTMDTLLELRESRGQQRGQEFMTLGFEGDQLVRQIHTVEEIEEAYAFIVGAISAVETHCEILPSDGAEDLRLDGALDRFAAGEVLDAIHLARANTLTLLSEDLHIRQVAASVGVEAGAWVQVVLFVLTQVGLIDYDQYCIHIGQLGSLRHGHLWLDVRSLAGLRRLKDPRKEGLWRSVLPYMFGPSAELTSHLSVVIGFMLLVVQGGLEKGGSYRSLSQLLLRMVVAQPQGREMMNLLDADLHGRAIRGSQAAATAHSYLQGWMRGHFLLAAASASRIQGMSERPADRRAARRNRSKKHKH